MWSCEEQNGLSGYVSLEIQSELGWLATCRWNLQELIFTYFNLIDND